MTGSAAPTAETVSDDDKPVSRKELQAWLDQTKEAYSQLSVKLDDLSERSRPGASETSEVTEIKETLASLGKQMVELQTALKKPEAPPEPPAPEEPPSRPSPPSRKRKSDADGPPDPPPRRRLNWV